MTDNLKRYGIALAFASQQEICVDASGKLLLTERIYHSKSEEFNNIYSVSAFNQSFAAELLTPQVMSALQALDHLVTGVTVELRQGYLCIASSSNFLGIKTNSDLRQAKKFYKEIERHKELGRLQSALAVAHELILANGKTL